MSGRHRGTAAQARRILRLGQFLAGRRALVAVDELAQRLGVSTRQLRRDLATLESGGQVLERTSLDGRAAVRLAGGPRLLPLTRRERYSLLAARGALRFLNGSSFAEDLDSACAKLAGAATAAERAELRALARAFVYVPDGGVKHPPDADDLDALITGALDRRIVEATYGAPRRRAHAVRLAPYALVVHRNGLYVVGRKEPDDAVIRTWAIERFRDATFVRGSQFVVPEDFDAAAYFAEGVGVFGAAAGAGKVEVVVEFTRAVAPLVRARTWHGSQRLESVARGVRLTLAVSDWTPLVSWILSWGWHAVPRVPRALVERVRSEHHAALAVLGRRAPPRRHQGAA